jgi:membrane protein YdbS with pleckstrin-like domain
MIQDKWLKLHPNAKIALIIKPAIGIIIFSVFISLSFIGMMISGELPILPLFIAIITIIVIIFILLIVWAIMFYNRYLFRIGEDAVYINRGILWKRNVVIPYERIQHTSVTRGPIDMLLGLHILNIFTAGTGSVGARFGGAASAFAAEGSIPGLGDPKPFQEAIMSKVHSLKGDGFGITAPRVSKSITSTSEKVIPPESSTQDEMLKELRKIREILEKRN